LTSLLDDAELLASKLREETEEVIAASATRDVVWECADVLYHLMVRMRATGVAWQDVANELRARQRPAVELR
jgi:phosphoribosyl-ATP pyrophosphohydrolase